MIWLEVLCALGLPVGFLLLGRIRFCTVESTPFPKAVSIIIPARNEEKALPLLLNSMVHSRPCSAEVVVVDDGSIDATAAVSRSFGAKVHVAEPLPSGWTGKTWACTQGVRNAQHNLLLFVDADTYFSSNGLSRVLATYGTMDERTVALSILPYHVMEKPYEQLSLFFHLMMAIGAGGFGRLGEPRLFGQSLLISRSLYETSGGHASVRSSILENFALAERIASVGGSCATFGGRGVLNVRLYPNGVSELCQGWVKAFADGAAACRPLVLAASVFWLTTMCAAFIGLLVTSVGGHWAFVVLYLCFALQVFGMSRQLGTYRLWSWLLYPVPLFFYFGLFGHSFYLRAFGRSVQWRGRTV
jgi:4,4'-diaponeurosporenoate glycosyltransferase